MGQRRSPAFSLFLQLFLFNLQLVQYLTDHRQLPLQFDRIGGNFECYSRNLTTMVGFPRTVKGNLAVEFTHFLSLEGIPKHVGGSILISVYPDMPLMRLIQCKVDNNILLNAFSDLKLEIIEDLQEILNKYKNQGNKGVLLAAAEILKLNRTVWMPKYKYDGSAHAKL